LTTPVLLVNEDDESQRVTVALSRSTLLTIMSSGTVASLPPDEGLDEASAYRVLVKVTG